MYRRVFEYITLPATELIAEFVSVAIQQRAYEQNTQNIRVI